VAGDAKSFNEEKGGYKPTFGVLMTHSDSVPALARLISSWLLLEISGAQSTVSSIGIQIERVRGQVPG
jgi:hypothetical protein